MAIACHSWILLDVAPPDVYYYACLCLTVIAPAYLPSGRILTRRRAHRGAAGTEHSQPFFRPATSISPAPPPRKDLINRLAFSSFHAWQRGNNDGAVTVAGDNVHVHGQANRTATALFPATPLPRGCGNTPACWATAFRTAYRAGAEQCLCRTFAQKYRETGCISGVGQDDVPLFRGGFYSSYRCSRLTLTGRTFAADPCQRRLPPPPTCIYLLTAVTAPAGGGRGYRLAGRTG